MLISCVYPAYNRAGLFQKTLETIAEQEAITVDDYEIIVVDDQSTDNMRELCQEWGARLPILYLKVDVLRMPVVSGIAQVFQYAGANNPSAANNVGIRQARAPRVLLSSPEIYHLHRTNLSVLARWPLGPRQCLIANVYEGEGGMGIIGGGTARRRLHFLAAYPKQMLEDLGGFDEDFMGGYAFEDQEFVERCDRVGIEFLFTMEDVEAYHQPHPRVEDIDRTGWNHNEALNRLKRQRGQTVANEGRVWGSSDLIVESWESELRRKNIVA